MAFVSKASPFRVPTSTVKSRTAMKNGTAFSSQGILNILQCKKSGKMLKVEIILENQGILLDNESVLIPEFTSSIYL